MGDFTRTEHLDGKVTLYGGDNRDVLKSLPDNSIDSIVTDPPYALVSIQKRFGKPGSAPVKVDDASASNDLKAAYARASAGFMGKQWDTGEVAFSDVFWAECLRVLKPGGHVVAFSGTRTYHRMAVSIEDAGFEIRDQLAWCYGSGFPKSHDVSKAIDKHLGAEREKVRVTNVRNPKATGGGKDGMDGATRPWIEAALERGYHEKAGDEPATPAAREWQGWGTALKPAWEPICLARKPLAVPQEQPDGEVYDADQTDRPLKWRAATVAENVLEHGTGAINVDGCRVGTEGGTALGRSADKSTTDSVGGYLNAKAGAPIDAGRWPANLIHDGSDDVLAAFPDAPGQQRATGPQYDRNAYVYGKFAGVTPAEPRLDQGSAARFFYCAKASRKDREEGLENHDKKAGGMVSNTSGQHITRRDEGYNPEPRANTHPTVKPTALMEYLCRLVTPVGGTVLDPFMGSGSTGKAAVFEGFKFIGIEREVEYFDIARARIEWAGNYSDPLPAVAKQAPAANDNAQGSLFDAA